MKRFPSVTITMLAIALAAAFPPSNLQAQAKREVSPKGQQRLIREIRHELVLLPYYGVFDNLAFRLDGSKVVLLGQVTRPVMRTDAGKSVAGIEGIESVDNQIEVLPLSPNDDRLRLAIYRAIFSTPGLDRYSLRAVPPIHIIVKNGNCALEGVVATEADKNLAGIKANGVAGVFSVRNNLVVEKE